MYSLSVSIHNYYHFIIIIIIITVLFSLLIHLFSGVCLRDLTYYEEGDTKSPEEGMINFKQSKNVYSVLHYVSFHLNIIMQYNYIIY